MAPRRKRKGPQGAERGTAQQQSAQNAAAAGVASYGILSLIY